MLEKLLDNVTYKQAYSLSSILVTLQMCDRVMERNTQERNTQEREKDKYTYLLLVPQLKFRTRMTSLLRVHSSQSTTSGEQIFTPLQQLNGDWFSFAQENDKK